MSGKTIRIDAHTPSADAMPMLKALASTTRIAVLRYLGDRVVPVNRIALDLGLPPSTATMHIGILERAGLIHTEMRPASRGLQKVCARTYDELLIELPREEPHPRQEIMLEMPIGAYSDFSAEPTCGLAAADGLIGLLDDPGSFYEPDRIKAQLIWFHIGFLEYRFPNRVPARAHVSSLQLSAEVCSEAPLSDPDWPSDISVWVNDVRLGSWTSPGDFGGDRGRLTPAWWEEKDSQFGLLKRWTVNRRGSTIDGMPLSSVAVDDLNLKPGDPIRVRIGVERDARHAGGMNLFGRGFGNYPQDLSLRLEFERVDRLTNGNGTQPTGALSAE